MKWIAQRCLMPNILQNSGLLPCSSAFFIISSTKVYSVTPSRHRRMLPIIEALSWILQVIVKWLRSEALGSQYPGFKSWPLPTGGMILDKNDKFLGASVLPLLKWGDKYWFFLASCNYSVNYSSKFTVFPTRIPFFLIIESVLFSWLLSVVK